ncbi:MAG: aldehyde ferredoxin oxidoreductase family protein [Smithellaceae bacterium]|nr:aldehyde ferredoxin oxidoreductase family protein [Smithellaceae bacterium]
MIADDSLANVLYVDLTKKRFKTVRREDLFSRYLGGAGVAAQLLLEECPEGCDPLSPESPIIMAVGPLTAMFPLASKTVAMFKSPLTGNLGESHCGGRSAIAIRSAGYGAVVIKGASATPIYLAIHGNKVMFRDASSLWGMVSSFTVGRIIRENEPGAGVRTIMRIGGAGENLVAYACVTTETYRHFGRLGMGAVFGSKKLKAVVISGNRSVPVADGKGFREVYEGIYQAAVTSAVMKKYHDLGTAENINPLNELGGLPTKNLTETRLENAKAISGEDLAEHFLGRRLACSHCPVGCIHIAALREPYVDEAYFYKTSMISYDYEPIYSLGSMLGIADPKGLLKLIEWVEKWAFDAMSAGVVLAWATEAQERGLISEEDLGLKLSWGDYETYMEALERIVRQKNGLYQALARGLDYTIEKYGGADFALSFGGNEMPGYHTGPGAHLGVLIGARHSHLDNGGYSYDQKVLPKRAPEPAEMAAELLKEERWRQILSSLVVCFFARGIYTPEVVLKALSVAGFELTEEDLDRLGREIHQVKYRFKMREGFSFEKLRIPRRILETPGPFGMVEEDFLRKAIDAAKGEIFPDQAAR